MGRTQRRRRQKLPQKFVTCNDDKELILFNSWLSKQGVRYNDKLYLAVFKDTGRGVLTKKRIHPGEELVNLPLNSTINVTTLLMDKDFCSIFSENKLQCLVKYQQSVSFQSLMAFYLLFLKVQGSYSKWFVYLQSLPKSYSVPYFLPGEVINYIEPDLSIIVNKQIDIINHSFMVFQEILLSSTSNSQLVKKLQNKYELSMYEWAYFTVNTRCVYIDLTNIVDLKNIQCTLLNIISDNTKISLCPYLDMINHSCNAKNETKLMVHKSIENVNLDYISEDLFSDIRFSIYTKDCFEPFTEVYICYGDSHNLKLITEYGFYLPNNDLDFVPFQYDDVLLFLESSSIKLSQDQINFINNHGLQRDLYIDVKGLSFNLYGLLMVVKYYYKNMDVSKMIYSAAICSSDKILTELITPMIRNKLENIKLSIEKLEKFDSSDVLGNCVALMYQYVSILEKFIKC